MWKTNQQCSEKDAIAGALEAATARMLRSARVLRRWAPDPPPMHPYLPGNTKDSVP